MWMLSDILYHFSENSTILYSTHFTSLLPIVNSITNSII